MALEWVKRAIERSVGFVPYPGTLNLALRAERDRAAWRDVKERFAAVEIPPPDSSFCAARLYPARIVAAGAAETELPAAVLLPRVAGYPEDKIEVIAGASVKETLGVEDGDALVIEFVA